MSNPSDALNSPLGKSITNEVWSGLKQTREYNLVENTGKQYGNLAVNYGKYTAKKVWNSAKRCYETIFTNGSSSTSSTSGTGSNKNNSAAFKNAISSIGKHFDLGSLLDGKIVASIGDSNFKVKATGSVDVDWMGFLNGDMSALKFSYA